MAMLGSISAIRQAMRQATREAKEEQAKIDAEGRYGATSEYLVLADRVGTQWVYNVVPIADAEGPPWVYMTPVWSTVVGWLRSPESWAMMSGQQ